MSTKRAASTEIASTAMEIRSHIFCLAARKYSRMAATPLSQISRGGLVRGLPNSNSRPPSRPVSRPNVEGRAVSWLSIRHSVSRPVSWPIASGRTVSWLSFRTAYLKSAHTHFGKSYFHS